ncbi:protein PIN-LIKES 3-like [Impatiens glandulifera]|uniref:protein PIN-LIKES 3-like n=1 Tax=Impatiens glandulifera TaxID=253017 RepID=UPI001FB0A4A1|nr:protein PIN-LIKES 3-like [Impatiens glandulifera]XP_047334476.1 protein PIN-LIKES 3-like [Impatiens glandulifera]
MALLELFIAASMPVLKVLLITALGAYLALDRINILGEDSRKHVNNLVFYVFSPALICSNLAKALTFDSMIELWFMPVNILLTFIVGSALGWVVVHMTRAPLHLRGLIIGCCAAGNLGNMLLIIIPAVCKEKGSPFGSPDVCREKGLTYASLSMAIGAIYLWSYVYNIVRISSCKKSSEEVEAKNSSASKAFSASQEPKPGDIEEPLLSGKEHIVSEYAVADDNLPSIIFENKSQISILERVKQYFAKLDEKMNLKRLFAPSTNGAIAGFVVGLVPQIKWLLIGDEAPLRVIQDSAFLLGDGAIPTLTLIIGGNLLKGLKGAGLQKSIIVGIIIARYIVLPLIGIGIVKGVLHIGLVNPSPLYQFVLLLQFALPPAMNIGTITQLFGTGESECSVIMLWTYILASISLTLWSTFFMWLVTP